MKIALKRKRKAVLCELAGFICGGVRRNFHVFELNEIKILCRTTATLCREAGCKEPSENCMKIETLTNETDFYKVCRESCSLCVEARKKKIKKMNGTEVGHVYRM